MMAKTGARVFALAAVVLSLAVIDHASADVVCGQDRATAGTYTWPYTWCIDKVDGSTNNDEIVYFHGLTGNEKSWQTGARPMAVRKSWASHGVQQPTVISISFGQIYVLTNIVDDQKQRPALLPLVLNTILPTLEARAGGLHGERILWGESMGGLNSAEVMFAAPEMFSRVALLCAAFGTVGPFSSQADLDAFFARSGPWVQRGVLQSIFKWARTEYQTPENYQAHDPLRLIQSTTRALPPMLVQVDGKDDLGFTEGDTLFANTAKERGYQVDFLTVSDGGHCGQTDESIAAIAEFLAHGAQTSSSGSRSHR